MDGMRAEGGSDEETRHGPSKLAPPAPELRVGKRLAAYLVEDVAGRGGMGVVYRAKHLALDRVVALKVLLPDLVESPDFRERFLRESRTAASLEHPSIVPVYDAGEAEGLLYIAMRYIDGTDLGQLLDREGALEPPRALRLLQQVAGALDAAHAHGVVHRDVKPANVLIASEHCYLTDFGLTKRISSQTALTARGQFVGTVHYVAPEQIEGGEVDARTDVYALACVAYHSLAGRVPFERDSEISVVYAHLKDAPPALMAARPDLPTGLDAVLAKALAKRRDDRHSSCGELVAEIGAVLEGADPAAASTATAPIAKVLVAGDEPRMRALLRGTITTDGLGVVEAASGEAAVAVARKEQPRLALIDWDMSSAGDTCRALRDHPETADIKIVAIVARAGADEQDAARWADDCIQKPFSHLQLLYKVRDLAGLDLGAP